MKQMPQIHKFMTTMPHTIDEQTSLPDAMKVMSAHQIRHLPILSEGKLVGVLTDRDVKLASSFKGADTARVIDVMTTEPYAVLPEVFLDQVVLEMAEHKYGCAIIVQGNGKTVGIFTANDALRVLGEQLRNLYKHGLSDADSRIHS